TQINNPIPSTPTVTSKDESPLLEKDNNDNRPQEASKLIIADGVVSNRLKDEAHAGDLLIEEETIDPSELVFTVVEKPQIETHNETAAINVVKEGLHLELPQEADFLTTVQHPAHIDISEENVAEL